MVNMFLLMFLVSLTEDLKMRELQQYAVSNHDLLIELLSKGNMNPVTWCSFMDVFKTRLKRKDSQAMKFWFNEMTYKSIERGHITIREKEQIMMTMDCDSDYTDGKNAMDFQQIINFHKTNDLFTTIIMLISDFFNKKDGDFDLQFEVIQDILLYNKLFAR